MIGSHHTSTVQSRRLTTAGLIAVTAATLLMMAWAIFPTSALADQTISIENGSLSSHGCDDTEWHFIINGLTDQNNNGSNNDEAPATIHVTWANGASANVSVAHTPGGTAHYHTTANLDSTVTGATAVIYDGWDGVFTLSHGPCDVTTSSTTATTSSTTATTTTPPGGTTTTPPTTTTTDSPTVSPTTVTPSDTTDVPTVNPTTVQPPDETAFTGPEDVVPIGALALMLLTTGSGLLWAGSRRRREGMQDE